MTNYSYLALIRQKRLIWLPIWLITILIGCQEANPDPMEEPTPTAPEQVVDAPLSYLALGDSYTIGTSVDSINRWPTQLRDSLRLRGVDVGPPAYIARNGWSTAQLLAGIEAATYADTFDMVSLLIGVNNQFRRIPFDVYQEEFLTLLNRAIAYAQGQEDHVWVVSIPDYGVTSFGQSRNPEQIAQELDNYNDYARRVCDSIGITYFYITDLSREAETDLTLVAPDNLHPSGEQYRRWVARIVPTIAEGR